MGLFYQNLQGGILGRKMKKVHISHTNSPYYPIPASKLKITQVLSITLRSELMVIVMNEFLSLKIVHLTSNVLEIGVLSRRDYS